MSTGQVILTLISGGGPVAILVSIFSVAGRLASKLSIMNERLKTLLETQHDHELRLRKVEAERPGH